MGTKNVKSDYIKVRVTTEEKELFKRVAELKKTTMSELVIESINEKCKRELEKINNKDFYEQRSNRCDEKLSSLKEKLINKKKE